MSRSASPATRLVPVENTCGDVHATPWRRAISIATGNHCDGSARQVRNVSKFSKLGREGIT
ncbi:MAG: hypothetical protein ACJ8FZ_01700 [Bradyrhizobium sp.]